MSKQNWKFIRNIFIALVAVGLFVSDLAARDHYDV